MKILRVLSLVGLIGVLVACGSQTQAPPSAAVVISSPSANAEFVTGSPVVVEGTAPLGAEVSVVVGTAAPVIATLLEPAGGRQPWRAEVVMPGVGSHTITATAKGEGSTIAEAKVQVQVVGLQPYGWWQGVFTIDNRPIGGELVQGGTMMVRYSWSWFRMYFAASGLDVEGTTDGWDLIDQAGLRIVGTYHAAGGMDEQGQVITEPRLDFHVVLGSGAIIEASLTLDD